MFFPLGFEVGTLLGYSAYGLCICDGRPEGKVVVSYYVQLIVQEIVQTLVRDLGKSLHCL